MKKVDVMIPYKLITTDINKLSISKNFGITKNIKALAK